MNARWQRRLQRLTRALGWTAGVALVALAVLVALAQLLLPLLARQPQWVAAQLEARLHRTVTIGSMEGRWQGAGPLLLLHDVRVGLGRGQPLRVAEAQLQLDLGAWLLPSRRLLNLHLRDMHLDLVHERNGQWHVDGMGADGPTRTVSLGPASLDLWLDDLRMGVIDRASGHQYRLRAERVRLSRRGDTVRVGALLRREGAGGTWRAAAAIAADGSHGRAWVHGGGLDLHTALGDTAVAGYVAEQGHGELSAWIDWSDRRIDRTTLRLKLDQLAIRGPAATARVDQLHGIASLTRAGEGWQLRYRDDDGGLLAVAIDGSGTSRRITAGARGLDVAPLLPWLALKPGLAPALAAWLGSGHPHGRLGSARLRWSATSGLASLQVDFRGLGIDAIEALPGVTGLDGSLLGDDRALALELPAQATVLNLPRVLRQPLALARLHGTLAAWRTDAGWTLGADPLRFEGDGFAAHARGRMRFPAAGGRPFLALYAHVDHAQVTAAKLFWPVTMPPGAIGWLDRALVGGTVEAGDLIIRGNLADWPFRQHEGRFVADATIHDATLDYGEEWPRAEGLAARVHFEDNGMLVQLDAGQSLGVKLDHAVALIPDFGEVALDLNAQGNGRAADLLQFLRHSPVARRQADTLAGLKLGGNGQYRFHLWLPVGEPDALRVEGEASLRGVDVDAPQWQLQLAGLGGPVAFDAHGAHAGPLSGAFRGQPATLDLAVGAATGGTQDVLDASLRGRFSLAELLQGHEQLDWLAAASQGRSDFTIGLAIPGGTDAPAAQRLRIDSTLEGMAVHLPAPLGKPAAGRLPVHVELGLPPAGQDLTVALDGVMHARFRLPATDDAPLAGTIALGDDSPAALPARGLRIRGHADRLDVSGWVQHAVAGTGAGGPGLESIDVSAGHALIFEHDFRDMQVKATPEAQALAIDVDSPGMAGQVEVPTVDLDKRGITARLQRLYWPQTGASPEAHADSGKTATAASAASVPASVPTPAEAAATGIDPGSLPPLHVVAGDLRVGQTRLGEARLETWPTARGMHIDQLRALSRSVQISGSGDWEGDAAASHTRMRMDFAATDLGSLLAALGYQGLFEGGRTRAHLDAGWPGAPSSLALANLDGTLAIDVSHGRVPEVNAGVGRLFGLVSLTELPRRLTLDFGDVFGKGLAFDSIKGTFRFADGNATTDDLAMHGPAADIAVSGRTGLRAHDYDQRVLVVPHVGNSLPVVGAVVGGPVGAAAGFAVQGLLGKGLNRAASARYKVTGSWDKPVFTLLEKHAAAAPPPAAGKAPQAAAGAPASPATASPPAVTPAPAASTPAPAASAPAPSATH